MRILELNEYIEKFSEIRPHLDLMLEDFLLQRVEIINDGCSKRVVGQVVKYLEYHGITVK